MAQEHTPVKAALRAYAEASKRVHCPICESIESCDHTVRERLLDDLGASSQAEIERLREALGYIAKYWPEASAAKHARAALSEGR